MIKYDQWQLDFLETKGDKILCCGRQIGKSEVCAKDAGDYAIKNPKTKPIVMIAPTERQAYGLFTKTLNYLLEVAPKLVSVGKDRPTKERIKLKNGVEIYCLPVGKDGLGIRFLTIGRLYVDEASRIPELVWDAIEPALLTTGGDEILLSTPFGSVGTFYEIFINKDNAYNSFTRFSKTSEDVIANRPISESWTEKQREKALMKLEQAKKRWSVKKYAQEYLGEFVADLHRWFSDELINKCCIGKREKLQENVIYYMGCDIARMGEDEGTFEIFKKYKDKIIQVENIITTKRLITETRDKIIELDSKYNFKKIFIDAGTGGLGVSVLDICLEVPQIRRKMVAINNSTRPLEWNPDKIDNPKSTGLFKNDLYENLRALMEQDLIILLEDEEIQASLQSVQYEYLISENQETRLKIWGDYTHIVEGIIRGAWCNQYKDVRPFIETF